MIFSWVWRARRALTCMEEGKEARNMCPQVPHAQSSQSRVALFVSLASIHLYGFYNVTWRWRMGAGRRIFYFNKLPSENIKTVLSKLRSKGF